MRNAYVIRVNIHRAGWDGTVCSHPTEWLDCKASALFKSDYCERGTPRCFHLDLFATSPRIRLPRKERPYADVVGEQRPEPGDIAVFWGTYADGEDVPVGVWIIEDFRIDGDFIIYGSSKQSIRFPERSVGMKVVRQQQTKRIGADMIRFLEPPAIGPVLDQFAADLNRERASREIEGIQTDDFETALSRLRDIRATVPQVEEGSSQLTYRLTLPEGALEQLFGGDEQTEPKPIKEGESSDSSDEEVSPVPTDPMKSLDDAPLSISSFTKSLRDRYSLAIATSSMVLLAGPSGVGKTQLVRAFAESIGARFEIVPVRPDWRSNEDLLGYLPPFGGDFVPSTFSRFVLEASDEWEKAEKAGRSAIEFHVCLDEMNLARPEYYLAEVLSRMEMTGALRSLQLHDSIQDSGFPQRVPLPPNLTIIGTVNNDDTTNPLSPKVLDRAAYLLCDDVDLVAFFGARVSPEIVNFVAELDQTLRQAGLRIAYRTAGSIERWIRLAAVESTHVITALDEAVETFVLPKLRLQRSNQAHVEMLEDLRVLFAERYSTEEVSFVRCVEAVDRLAAALERSDFANGQFET